jgi:hypothetical protein
MDQQLSADHARPRRLADGPFLVGVVLIVIGAATLVERLQIVDLDSRHWPFVLLAIGVVRLLDPPRSGQVPRSLRPGMWLILIGSWGLVSELGLFGLGYRTSWPLLVVFAGLMVVWRSFEGPDACKRPQER